MFDTLKSPKIGDAVVEPLLRIADCVEHFGEVPHILKVLAEVFGHIVLLAVGA